MYQHGVVVNASASGPTISTPTTLESATWTRASQIIARMEASVWPMERITIAIVLEGMLLIFLLLFQWA